jgi:hypothetical protein
VPRQLNRRDKPCRPRCVLWKKPMMAWGRADPPLLDTATVTARGLISDIHTDLNARLIVRDRQIAGLNQLLAELADRLTGGALEEERRRDPSAPQHWQAADWQAFFSRHPWQSRVSGLEPSRVEVERLTAQVAQWQDRARALERQLAETTPAASAEVVSIAPAPSTSTPLTAAELLAELTPLVKRLPDPPRQFAQKIAYRDPKHWQRQALTLYLIGLHGLSQQSLIHWLLGRLAEIDAGSGSIERPLEKLVENGLLERTRLELKSPFSATLIVLSLTDEGRRLVRLLFDAEVVESDIERIRRLHQGDDLPAHTLGLLYFALTAMQRGACVRMLPEVPGEWQPDLWIKHAGVSYYVEVELSDKENPAKWRRLADLNERRVALCAGNTTQRAHLVSDCRAMKLHGVATDLETLAREFKEQRAAAETQPLFQETW